MFSQNWNRFVFRQFVFYRSFKQQWSRIRAKTHHYSSFLLRNDRRFMLALASAAGFSFKEHGISDARIAECDQSENEFAHCKTPGKDWELLYEEKDMLAFRRRIEGPYEMFEYKCVGTYYDISPRTFLDAQNDLNYRREWDDNISSIEVVEEEHENELIRWVSKFPYPLYPREYVYVRRTWVSEDEKFAVVDSESVQPEVFPSTSDSNVRVRKYSSRMSIKAHSDWESHGVDYILTYSDNPEANIPRYVYNWMVNKGGPYFLKQVHKAAREIEEKGKEVRSATEKACITKNGRVAKRILDQTPVVEEHVDENENDRKAPSEKEEKKVEEKKTSPKKAEKESVLNQECAN